MSISDPSPIAAELAIEADPFTPDHGTHEVDRITRSSLIWRRFFRNRTAAVGLVIFLMVAFFAVFGTHITKWGYLQIDNGHYLEGPTGAHWFGTNQSGSDIFALTIRGLRKSLIIGVVTAVVTTGLSAIVGSFAAYFGGAFDAVALWVINLLLVIPSFLLIAIIMRGGASSSGAGMWVLIAGLSLFGWMLTARVVRSITMSIRERDYVRAAKYMGVPGPRIVFRHILPNIASLLVIDATLNVGFAILGETGLSFLGLGIRSPDTSLGTLIADGQTKATTFPWLFIFPSLFLVLIVLSINMLGDGLRDAFDPSSQSGGRA